MQVYTLFEGTYSVDATKKFVPFDPAIHSYKDRPASLFINVQPFLVELKNDLILFDTGLGFSDDHGELILHKNIRNAGFDPTDVTKVLMSHLHYDHSGGMIHKQGNNKVELSFPDAEYVINRGEWETAFSSTSSSYHSDIFDFVQRNAQLRFVEGDGALDETITYEFTGAHCPNHQVFLLTEGKQKVFFGGDVLPEPEELVKNFIAKYDFDGRKAMELRKEFGKRAAEENWECLFYHGKSAATGFVDEVEGGFKIR
ncbi:MBL fold metallo-hydrolase [Pedobacter riviphilus]|uniref:MBL fold metallo-hydrolase n=1 Tax=Pedobacter riviphilus TaxID=2766984 RepID=A0ABX6TJ04_9SPHI|nr:MULTISPECIES: MBL fold metallo-hydrolase [Pedobacter]NII85136.1 glyoxylase-like metal-dependent hydrolase (beta-lactamase superfamily II) [Pedobacter sp. SG908]NMN37956.1 glyoxylase-like metal-dependent hydrolase (beta-lactamase superfamily II) [Pedobacter sp. SG918]QNR84898.1 MBL fold metallo-hydrolase [Pedobacter riviphilus]